MSDSYEQINKMLARFLRAFMSKPANRDLFYGKNKFLDLAKASQETEVKYCTYKRYDAAKEGEK